MITTREQIRAIRDEIAALVPLQVDEKGVLHQPHNPRPEYFSDVQSIVAQRAAHISALHNWSLELRGKAPCHGEACPYKVYAAKLKFAEDRVERAEVEAAEAERRERLRAIA